MVNILNIIIFKGEIQNRFNLISEEKVKFLEQNSENLMKIGWKISKLWLFEVSQIFAKHFWKHRYEYANDWVDAIASLLVIYILYNYGENFDTLPNLVIICPSYQDILESTLFCIFIHSKIKASLTFS